MIKTTRDKLDILAEKIASLAGQEIELVASETFGAQEVEREMTTIDLDWFQNKYLPLRKDEEDYYDEDESGETISSNFEAF